MIRFLLAFLSWFGAFFRSRHDLGLELVALRQQVGVLKRNKPQPLLSPWDRLFWIGLGVGGQNGRVCWCRAAGDRLGLASRPFPLVLAFPFAPPFLPTENHPRAPPSHPIHGGREPNLGCSPDPRRALEIEIRKSPSSQSP